MRPSLLSPMIKILDGIEIFIKYNLDCSMWRFYYFGVFYNAKKTIIPGIKEIENERTIQDEKVL